MRIFVIVMICLLMGYSALAQDKAYRSLSRSERKVLDNEDFFYSNAVWDKYIKFFDKNTNFEFKVDSTSTKLLFKLGHGGAEKEDFEFAIKLYKLAHDFSLILKLKDAQAASYHNLGYAYKALGAPDKALLWYKRAVELRQRLTGLESELAITYSNMGHVYRSQGRLEKAQQYYEKAKNLQEISNQKNDESESYLSLAKTHYSKGNFKEAVNWTMKAIEIQKKLELKLALSWSYINLGEMYDAQGNLDQASIWYEAGLGIQEDLNLKNELSESYSQVGLFYFENGNAKKALELERKAMDIFKSLNLEEDLAKSYRRFGMANFDLGNFAESEKYYDLAFEISKKLNLEDGKAAHYHWIGQLFYYTEDLGEALVWFERAAEIRQRLNLRAVLANTYDHLGAVYYSQKDYATAIPWFEKALEIYSELNYGEDVAISYNNLATMHSKLGNFESSLYYANKGLQLRESHRSVNRSSSNRKIYIDRSLDIIEIGLNSAFRLENLKNAFIFSEKNKSRGLQDLLIERSIKVSDHSEELLSSIHANDNRLKVINQKLSTKISAEERSILLSQRGSLYQFRTQLQHKIKVTAPEFANLVYPQTINSQEIQSTIQEYEALISFFAGQINTFAFIQTSSELQVIDLGPSESLSHLVKQFRNDYIPRQKAILTSEPPNRLQQSWLNKRFFQLSSQLYQKLWAPLDSTGLLKGKEIILVPDGFLHYLPFEILVKDRLQKKHQYYQYLIKDHPISYYPSASVLHFERTNKYNSPKPEKDYFGLAVSNFDQALCTKDGMTLDTLNNTGPFVKSIQNYFRPESSTVLINEHASVDSFSALELKDYRYLHFATHGQINSKTPEFSNILLHDGCLNLYEIFELELNADLVVLSACETGLGKLVAGEGMIGFTRALMYAGTPSIILSLWEVGANSTMDLFTNYYEKLSQDSGLKYASLREAQLQMIHSKDYSNPYFWAPFVFIGEQKASF